MAKQARSKIEKAGISDSKNENTITTSEKEKYNKTTLFLTKFIFDINIASIKKCGFVDSYTCDPEKAEILNLDKNKRFLFLLFKSKKLTVEDLSNIIKVLAIYNIKIPFSYELVNDYSMLVIQFPEKYIQDYDFFIEGKYSKLSKDFKSGFPETREVFNSKKQRIGKEYTIYYHIFNKTQWLKDYWMKRLNLVEIDDSVELWQQPDKRDLVFDLKNIIN